MAADKWRPTDVVLTALLLCTVNCYIFSLSMTWIMIELLQVYLSTLFRNYHIRSRLWEPVTPGTLPSRRSQARRTSAQQDRCTCCLHWYAARLSKLAIDTDHCESEPAKQRLIYTAVIHYQTRSQDASAVIWVRHPVPDPVKPSFVNVDIRALGRSTLSVGVPRCQKLQMAA